MRNARQFLVLIALCCTASFCALAGSALANWMIAIDHHAAPAINAPADATLDAPAAVEQRTRALAEASVHRREPAVDLYGNDVTDAVAKYTLGPTGVLYEEHSPQTELPRLAPPQS